MFPIPVRSVHSGRDGLCVTCHSRSNRCQPFVHSPVHQRSRSVRPHIQKFNDVQNLGGSRIAVVVAFREISVSASVPVHFRGFCHRATRRWRAGGSVEPLLFSLAIHNALVEVQAIWQDDEHLFAFLDDVYVLTSPERVRDVFNLVVQLGKDPASLWKNQNVEPSRGDSTKHAGRGRRCVDPKWH